MTQEQLAEQLVSTRHSVSKWENGVNIPNTEVLLKLGEIFNISINEILACQRRTKDTKDEVDNVSIKLISDNEKSRKTIKTFVVILASLVIIFLVYYFINTYNSLYVYKIAGENENFSTIDGIVIFSKNKSYLKFGEINGKRDYDYYELYYKDKSGKKIIIFNSEKDNDTLISIYNNDGYFSFKDKNEIVKSTYLKIQYADKNDVIKLKFQRDMVNSFSLFTKVNKINSVDKLNNNVSKEDDILKIEKYVKENFSYNKEENLYILKENNGKYQTKYSTTTKILEYYIYNNDITYIFEYSFIFKELKYLEQFIKKDEIKEIFTYSLENNKCIIGECDKQKIDSIIIINI